MEGLQVMESLNVTFEDILDLIVMVTGYLFLLTGIHLYNVMFFSETNVFMSQDPRKQSYRVMNLSC